jgi:deoxyribose-phosphate aldolase
MRILKNFKMYVENNDNINLFQYNNMIDYTLLDKNATDNDIIELCEKAQKLGTKSVCVYPKHISIAKKELQDSDVLVCTVISFPEGTNTIEEKEAETHKAISDGADEVDMVLNYQLLKEYWENQDDLENIYEMLVEEVRSLVDICHNSTNKDGNKITLKVIVESGLLSIDQTIITTNICLDANADFIKTSTGMVSVGAELDKIKAMYETINDENSSMKIKASGGVRTLNDIQSYKPYVDRFGMGYGSVDKLNGLDSNSIGY